MSVKDLYPAIRPSLNLDFANTKTLDPRITFSRASTGTYYDGVTHAKAEENLFTYSQDFANAAWTKENATITSNTVAAPDGTTTADKLVETAVNDFHNVQQDILASTDYVVSVYAKDAGDSRYLGFAGSGIGGANEAPVFDLVNGTVDVGGTTTIIKSASIESVGNGWYRCIASLTSPANANFLTLSVVISGTDNTVPAHTGDGTSGVYIWGAQLEQRSSATAYTATTTQPITNYIPVLQSAAAGEARFDHDPVTGESKGLLIEEQRTNLVAYSEDLSNAAWVKTTATVTSNTVIAPDGTLTGDKIISASGSAGRLTYTRSSLAAETYTNSFYAKAGEFDTISWRYSNSQEFLVKFDLAAGTATTVTGTPDSSSITNVGNGWYYCTVTITTNATRNYTYNLYTATGDGYSGVYAWGAQLEVGAFSTSYIATSGSQATRNADSASMTGTNFSEWYRQDEGSLFAEFQAKALINAVGNPSTVLAISDTTVNNRIRLITSASGAFEVAVGGTSQASLAASVSANAVYKWAAAYKLNDFAISSNGATTATDTAGNIPTVTQVEFGGYQSGRDMTGHIKKLAYYPERVTNAQLQGLTS